MPTRVLFADKPRRRFRLMRYFLLTSFVGLVVLSTVLVFVYRARATEQMLDHERFAHSDLARVFSNLVWEKHRDFVLESKGLDRDGLMADRRLRQMSSDVRKAMIGLRVVKVKVFNLEGFTVFSSDSQQIGEFELNNAGFLGAKGGQVISQVFFRDQLEGTNGIEEKRNLVVSYVPVFSLDTGEVEGVIGLYSDVSDLLDAKKEDSWQITLIVLGLLGLLYVFLFLVVRRAEAILKRQDQEQEESETKIRYQALHDSLTQLPNRVSFTHHLPQAVVEASRLRHNFALMFVDLDRFKQVNDQYGHEAGDAVLIEMAQRLQKSLRGTDRVYRIAGDEFTILAENLHSKEDARHLAERIRNAADEPVLWQGAALQVGVTVGIAVYPEDGNTPEVLLRNADAAMYAAKNAGRNQYAFFKNKQNDTETGVQSGAFVL